MGGTSAGWEDLQELEPGRRLQLLGKIREFVATHPMALLEHEPAWLAALGAKPGNAARFFVILDKRDDVVGYAPFLVHPSNLTVEAGHYTLFSYPIRRYTLTGWPLFADAEAGAQRLAAGLFAKLSGTLGARELPFCLGMDLDGPFASAIGSGAAQGGFFLMRRGPAYRRRQIALPATFDEYIGALGAKTRQDLRRQERRLQKESGAVTFRCLTGQGEVGEFLEPAQEISRRTYQWKLLHLGLRNGEEARRNLVVAATHGWMRCYVMFCGGEPAAFMLGYLHRRTYYSHHIGYDPRWSDWSPGNVLHLHVVRDIVCASVKAERFDFMYGDNSNKERLSNLSHREQNVYILPATFKWRLVAGSVAGGNAVLESGGRFLDRQGIKSRIRRFLRRNSARKP